MIELWVGNLHVESDWVHTAATIQSCNPGIALMKFASKFAELSWVYQRRSRQKLTHILLSFVILKSGVSRDRQTRWQLQTSTHPLRPAHRWEPSSIENVFCRFWYSRYFLPRKCYNTLICRIACTLKFISPSALGQPQSLFNPFSVINFIFDRLKGNIRLMRVLDDERLWKAIIKLYNEFWKWMQISHWWTEPMRQNNTYRQLEWLVILQIQLVLPFFFDLVECAERD